MKTAARLPKAIYQLIKWLDKTFFGIEEFQYQTAPFCGHHYYGHKGTLTSGHYSEVGGQEQHTNWLFECGHNDDEGYFFHFKPIVIGDDRKRRGLHFQIGSRFTLTPSLRKRAIQWRNIIDFSWLGIHITYHGKRKQTC